MGKLADKLKSVWDYRLSQEHPHDAPQRRQSIVRWLLGADLKKLERLSESELAIAEQKFEYRYQILQNRYLGTTCSQGYRRLIGRLGAVLMLRPQIQTWAAHSNDRQKVLADIVQKIIQTLLRQDPDLQQQISWIAECTEETNLRDTLLLATVEEYCLRPLHNQPLLLHRFVTFLRRQSRDDQTKLLPSYFLGAFCQLKALSQLNSQRRENWEKQPHSLATQKLSWRG